MEESTFVISKLLLTELWNSLKYFQGLCGYISVMPHLYFSSEVFLSVSILVIRITYSRLVYLLMETSAGRGM
jgi:hypothetical protein